MSFLSSLILHEQAPGNVRGPVAVATRLWLAVWRPTKEDIEAFEEGDFGRIKQFEGEPPISGADLRLSQAGMEFARLVRSGEIETKEQAADWIRQTLGGSK